jgi:hypothetical protein
MNFCKGGFLNKKQNKAWEIQISTKFEDGPYFNFSLEWTRKCDHAGPKFTIEILSFYFCLQAYDTRHWDYDNNCYQTYK